MRRAARPNTNRVPRSQTVQMQAPVKGWASERSPVDAEEGTALILDNWFCEAESLRPRRGFASHVTGVGAGVETLMTFTSASASKLFAAGDGEIYDVSSSGALGAAAVTGLTSDKWQYTMFATTGGQYLFIVNGADDARHYSGSAWAAPSITGVTSSTLVHVTAHKSRLWFAQLNTADLWYLAVDSIAGSATKFPLGAQLKRGGYIMAIGTWSVDAGDGMDDMLVAWSSEGEVLVYSGTDPSSNYALVGRYVTGKPIGRRCLYPVGGDLAMLSEDGVISISQVLKYDRAVIGDKAITKRVRNAYSDAVQTARESFGWQMIAHPVLNMALLNLPNQSDDGEVWQFALNVTTGAWSRFKGMDALCWEIYDNRLFFGTESGGIYEAETGGDDAGSVIETAILPAYSHLGAQGRLKHIKMVQPIFATDLTNISLGINIATDYEIPFELSSVSSAAEGVFTWDVSEWDGPDVWGGQNYFNEWAGSSGIGAVISPYTTINVDGSDNPTYTFRMTGWSLLYETGGVL